jgi:hypothetical protein
VPKQTKQTAPQHRWVALFLKMDVPGESHLVEWCAHCGKLKLKLWETKARSKPRPLYYLPNADYPRGEGSSHNSWSHREPPTCRTIPSHVLSR